MTVGTEHEYSINDANFAALPVSDQIIKSICGSFSDDILFGDVKLGKELQKTVLEFVPRIPASGPAPLEKMLVQGIRKFYHIFPTGYHLLGLGMHPTLTLDRTTVWDHDEKEYYEAYNRLFNIRQHGWLNIQAFQINLSYTGERDLLAQYNRIRSLLPYLIALSASSPIVEGRLTGVMDNRLVFYRENQKEVPEICNSIIPSRLMSLGDYRKAQDSIYDKLRSRDAEILCEEWLNSSGLILRFSRNCLEIKALDEQECARSDMAILALLMALLRSPVLPVESDHDELLSLTETAIRKGTAGLRPELETLFHHAWHHATTEERQYLPVIEHRITHGSLSEQIAERYLKEQKIEPILTDMAASLRKNAPYGIE
jgi:hypothetical protein